MSMKRMVISGVAGLFVVFLAVWAIRAQDSSKPAPAPAGDSTNVALVDINYIFKQNEAFKKEMDKLKSEADEMDKKMRESQAVLAMSQNDLKNLTPGSSEYSEMEAKIARLKTDVTLETQTKRREFLMREANIYRQTYGDIKGEIAKYAGEHQFDMVLRFSGDPVDSNNPQSVLADINKPVVYYDQELDITPYVIKSIVEKQKK
jgi:Skp family chaperone for outer membrane proteins